MARLDQELVARGLCDSRERARRLIMAAQVAVNGQRAQKASDKVKATDEVAVLQPEPYVSRGGLKLEHALLHFKVGVDGAIVVDLGASTGGFTDCLLQRGASTVYAVDVGHGQLAWNLRQDARVVVLERTNARHLSPAQLPPPFQAADLVVIDCSFISLTKLLPAACTLLKAGGGIVALIKPQFEAGKAEADKGAGVISDPAIHERVVDKIQAFACNELRLIWRGVTPSPILGPAGNKEFLVFLIKPE